MPPTSDTNPAPMDPQQVDAASGDPALERDSEKLRGEIWNALDGALRSAWSAKEWATPYSLAFPIFAITVELTLSTATVVDKHGLLDLTSILHSEVGLVGESLVLSPLGLFMTLIWLRVQAQASAALFVGFDRRVNAFDPEHHDPKASMWQAARPVAQDCFWILLTRYVLSLIACLVPLTGLSVLTRTIDPQAYPPLLFGLLLTAAIAFSYIAIIEVIANLAMVSAVNNRRGPVSALQHAWKLALDRPRATLRAGLGHFGVVAVSFVGLYLIRTSLGGFWSLFAMLFMAAFAGSVAACFWDRTYSLLGGWRSLPPLTRSPGADPSNGGSEIDPASGPVGAH
ncbi:MAG: hypothetical protein ACYSWX_06865 [Planctomycetota bacterium]|jgi:hypothetical protein